MIRVALVGCGRIADMHAPGYAGLSDARIYAVCDSDPAVAQNRKNEWKAERAYTRYADVLADPQVDAVEILTPQKLHEPMVVAAARAGKHVAVQKPMTISLPSARRMIDAMGTSGKVFKITENYAFYPPIVKARELIAAGALGEVTGLRMKMISGTSGGWAIPPSAWEWRVQERKEGRGFQTFDHGHHMWATAIELLGPVDRVSAWIDSQDGIIDSPSVMMWKHKSGTRYGMCEFTHAEGLRVPSKYYSNDEWFEVTGSKGIVFVRRCTGNINEGPPVSLYNSDGWTHFEDVPSDWLEGFKGATRDFIDAIKGAGSGHLGPEQGYDVLKFSLALQRSSELRREVYVDELDAAVPAVFQLKRRWKDRKAGSSEGFLSKFFGNTEKYAHQATELTRALVARFDSTKAGDWSASIGLRLSRPQSQAELLFGLVVSGGQASLLEGQLPERPVLTVTIPAGVWAAVLLKKMRIETAVLRGQIKADGRAEEALKLRAAFGL